ncbi:MAG: hypothetical protein DMF96_04995 [Acidobacteria bacterium]|nr:MAG: hypothetical protein DMF96_04995 [Acidobacteriota bacterium]
MMSRTVPRSKLNVIALAGLLMALPVGVRGQAGTKNGEWRTYGGDLGSTRYAPLDQINANNFKNLQIAWRFKTEILGRRPDFNLEATPLMINGVLYTTAGSRRDAVAIDAATGELLWMYRLDETRRAAASPRPLSGRGVAYWTDGAGDDRVFFVTIGYQLVGLDAKTGVPVRGFGQNGIVDLKQEDDQELDPITGEIGLNSAPVVARSVVIVGAAHRAGGVPKSKANAKGFVRGFDVRTGKRLWIFHTIPVPGEFGNDTWEKDSWAYTGNTGVWAPFSVDETLGLVYLPVELPTGDYYGGHRPGNGLFGESLVAVDLTTGRRLWHYQLIHHGVWDYDIPCAPVLADITVNGRAIKAVAQPTKQGFTYVFDRTNGQPVWPIEEKPVEQTKVPGEKTSPTQPIPTKPGSAEDGLAIQDGTGVHATDRQGSGRQGRTAVHPERSELARGIVRPRDRHPVRLLEHADASRVARQRSNAVRHGLRQHAGWRRHGRRVDGAGVVAREAALWTHHGDRSQQGRHCLAGAAWRHAGFGQGKPRAQRRGHPEDRPDWPDRHADDEDAGDFRRKRLLEERGRAARGEAVRL